MSGETSLDAVRDRCPNPRCIWHNPKRIPEGMQWYRKHGYYFSEQHGKMQRFVCLNCHKSFSARTDTNEWYLHFDNISIPALAKAWLAGGSVKEIAKEYGISRQMVRTRLRRSDVSDEWELTDDDPPKAS